MKRMRLKSIYKKFKNKPFMKLLVQLLIYIYIHTLSENSIAQIFNTFQLKKKNSLKCMLHACKRAGQSQLTSQPPSQSVSHSASQVVKQAAKAKHIANATSATNHRRHEIQPYKAHPSKGGVSN